MAQLTFLGTANAFNSGGRGHSAYWIEDALGVYTVDFGPTALMACKRLKLDLERLDGVLITHFHGDHIAGLTMLLLTLQFQYARKRPLVIAGPPGTQVRVSMLIGSTFPTLIGKAPIEWVEWPVPGCMTVLGRTVQTIRAKHDSLGVAASLRISTPELELAFSGDTGWQQSLPELVRGVDLFVCECSNVFASYPEHLSVDELVAFRDQLEVGQLFVSHLSMEARAAARDAPRLRAVVPEDGDVVEITRCDD